MVVQSALERALSAVSEELLSWASDLGDTSGCTAVTAVRLDDSILVAHIGDSKAILCQQESQSGTPDMTPVLYLQEALSYSNISVHPPTSPDNPQSCEQLPHLFCPRCSWDKHKLAPITLNRHEPVQLTAGHVHAMELTSDHSPGRKDERKRILAAGGSVTQSSTGGAWPPSNFLLKGFAWCLSICWVSVYMMGHPWTSIQTTTCFCTWVPWPSELEVETEV